MSATDRIAHFETMTMPELLAYADTVSDEAEHKLVMAAIVRRQVKNSVPSSHAAYDEVRAACEAWDALLDYRANQDDPDRGIIFLRSLRSADYLLALTDLETIQALARHALETVPARRWGNSDRLWHWPFLESCYKFAQLPPPPGIDAKISRFVRDALIVQPEARVRWPMDEASYWDGWNEVFRLIEDAHLTWNEAVREYDWLEWAAQRTLRFRYIPRRHRRVAKEVRTRLREMMQ